MDSSPKITNLPYKRLSLEDDVFGETTRRRSSFYSYRYLYYISVHNHLPYKCFDIIEDFHDEPSFFSVIQVQASGVIGRKEED